MAIGLGLIGFALLGAAMPDRRPRTSNFIAALPVVPLRFVAPVTTCLIIRALGVDVPAGAWVIENCGGIRRVRFPPGRPCMPRFFGNLDLATPPLRPAWTAI